MEGVSLDMLKLRTYTHYTREGVALLGNLIRLARKERRLTVRDLADRAGISRTTLQKIEKGDVRCEIGLVFETAALAGVKLFESDSKSLETLDEQIKDKIAVLPKSVRVSKRADDEF